MKRTRRKKNQEDSGLIYKSSFVAQSENQKKLYQSIMSSPMIIAVGPAGVGKSFVEASAAISLYMDGIIDRIVVLRNPLPTGNSLGFFPGTEYEKLAVWCQPIMDTFKKVINNNGLLQYLMNKQFIQFSPIETLKGISYDNTFIIVEESQECPMETLKLLATRIGENSVLCFNGDIQQRNSKLKNDDFLEFILRIKAYDQAVLEYQNDGYELELWQTLKTPVIEFNKDDVVRSNLCRKMIEVFYT